MYILLWQDWATIISLAIGIASLILTIVTYKKAVKIDTAINLTIEKERTKIKYPKKHKDFYDAVKKAIDAINDKNEVVINDLISTGEAVKAFYINWKDEDKAKLDDFLGFIKTLSLNIKKFNIGINNIQWKELFLKLCEIKAILEREFELK